MATVFLPTLAKPNEKTDLKSSNAVHKYYFLLSVSTSVQRYC